MINVFNFLIIIASGLSLIVNPYVLLVGRFIYGMSAGAMSVFVPKFINETVPPEYKGTFGIIT
jgi:MFS family permease